MPSLVVPELRRLHSPDLVDLAAGSPPDPEHFSILVQALIGPKGGPGEEAFDFEVCTPSWLVGVVGDRYLFPRHRLLLRRYDYRLLKQAILSVVRGTSGHTWREVAERLARYGRWEFEDYSDAAGVPSQR